MKKKNKTPPTPSLKFPFFAFRGKIQQKVASLFLRLYKRSVKEFLPCPHSLVFGEKDKSRLVEKSKTTRRESPFSKTPYETQLVLFFAQRSLLHLEKKTPSLNFKRNPFHP